MDRMTPRKVAMREPQQQAPTAAAFESDDCVTVFAPTVPDRHLERVTVAFGYGLYEVTDDGVTADRWGYVVLFDGKHCFAPAWMLRAVAHKPFHLQLIHTEK